MTHVAEMLQAHPVRSPLDQDGRARVIVALLDCVQTCTSCADACLNEPKVEELKQCIASNADCSDVCNAAARVLSRQTTASWALLRSQLEACIAACIVCGDECGKHSQKHKHCAVCAETCKSCAQACKQLLAGVPRT